jgi:hypothetical protein
LQRAYFFPEFQGRVTMDAEDGLSAEQKRAGLFFHTLAKFTVRYVSTLDESFMTAAGT